jgi:hypothetical protein
MENNNPENIEMFPYALLRIAGGPFKHLEELELASAKKRLEQIREMKGKISLLKEPVCEGIYNCISKSPNAVQNKLLNLKRNVFNDRKWSMEQLNGIGEYLTPGLIDSLTELAGLREKILMLENAIKEDYNEEVNSLRLKLKEIVKRDELRKGLILSSQSLLKGAESYINTDIKEFKKEHFKIELSLIKYISRIYAKTSPFSTFTNIAYCSLTPAGSGGFMECAPGNNISVKSHVRLNNYLFKYIRNLLYSNPNINIFFNIKANPTIRRTEDCYEYLVNSNNTESFQKIPLIEELGVILNFIKENGNIITPYKLAEKLLAGGTLDSTPEEIYNYISTLIGFGFLEYDLSVSGLDPDWHRSLILKLRDINHPASVDFASALEKLDSLMNEYAGAAFAERKQILAEAFSLTRNACLQLHISAGLPEEERITFTDNTADYKPSAEEEKTGENTEFRKKEGSVFTFTPERIFYEDTTIPLEITLDREKITELAKPIHSILSSMRAFGMFADEKTQMKFYFSNRYNGTGCRLFDFYKDFYADLKVPLRSYITQKQQENSPPENKDHEIIFLEEFCRNRQWESSLITGIENKRKMNRNIMNSFIEGIKSSLKENSTVNICPEEFRRLTEEAPAYAKGTYSLKDSNGGFVQFFEENGLLYAVLNQAVAGFGKFFSRFLHLLPPEVAEEIRGANAKLINEDEILAENTDASFFNANIHKPIIPYEICSPESNTNLETGNHINISDLQITYDTAAESLRLYSIAKNKYVKVLDLGFQNLFFRSELFGLLDKFSLYNYVTPRFLIYNIRGHLFREEGIKVCPRILLDNKVVLQRKLWKIPVKLLPSKGSARENPYYILNNWRHEMGMPKDIFLYVQDNQKGFKAETGAAKVNRKINPDDTKPQYISFDNPFLISLFFNCIEKADDYIVIEEMLPAPHQMQKFNNGRHAAEFLIQWN